MRTPISKRVMSCVIAAAGLSIGLATCSSVNAQTAEPTPPVVLTKEPQKLPPLPDTERLGIISGSALPLTMNEAIRRALAGNNQIEIARQDVLFAETSLRSLEGFFDPVFTVSPRYTNASQSTSQVFSGATSSTINSKTYRLDGSVNKNLSYGGGSYTGFFDNQRQSSNSSLFSPSFNPVLGLSYIQPLWRNREIDNTRRQIKIQKKQVAQTDSDFRRTAIEVITNVQRSYWDLVFALRNQQNRISNLGLSRENLRIVEAQINAGAAAPIQRAEVLTELANRESDLLLATQNVALAENALKLLIIKDSTDTLWSSSLTPVDNPVFNTVAVDLETATRDAIANRPELERLKLQREINAIDLQYFKNQTRPRVDLSATYSLNGLAGTPRNPNVTNSLVPLINGDPATVPNAFLLQQINVVRAGLGLPAVVPPNVLTNNSQTPPALIGGYGRALDNLFKLDTRTIDIGVTIQFPFRNRTAQANLAGARIQSTQLEAQTRAQEQTVLTDVRNAAQAVETARLRVMAARVARENAEVQLTGEQRLYQVGKSTTFILFQRENELANARNAEVGSETDFNKALADLQRATSTTFRANNVTVQSPAGP